MLIFSCRDPSVVVPGCLSHQTDTAASTLLISLVTSKQKVKKHCTKVAYENILDEFDIGHCPIKVKVMHDFEIILHLPQYKLSSPISQHKAESFI